MMAMGVGSLRHVPTLARPEQILQLVERLEVGAAGCISASANVNGPAIRRVWDAWKDGRDDRQDLQDEIIRRTAHEGA